MSLILIVTLVLAVSPTLAWVGIGAALSNALGGELVERFGFNVSFRGLRAEPRKMRGGKRTWLTEVERVLA